MDDKLIRFFNKIGFNDVDNFKNSKVEKVTINTSDETWNVYIRNTEPVNVDSVMNLINIAKNGIDEVKGIKVLDGYDIMYDEVLDYEKVKTPVYLIKELEIIDDLLKQIKASIYSGYYDKAIIISDHGASRLAVLHESENLWRMATNGVHSGRCCPKNEIDSKPNFAIDEGGFWVLANYDRFQGSRRANVEVHGGASLEEIVVPVITLSLKNSDGVEIKLNNPDNIYLDRKKGIGIDLYISYTENKNNVRVLIDGNTYLASTQDGKHYTVAMPDIKRAKTYTGEVYDGDNLIGMITARPVLKSL